MEKTGSTHIDELITLAVSGDGTAFTRLWDTCIGPLRTYLKFSVGKLDDFYIDDICSRSFEKAFRQIQTYDPSVSRFSTWLRTIAYRTALDVIEQEKRNNCQCVHIDESELRMKEVSDVSDDEESPLDTIIRDEDSKKNEHYVQALPELYREVAQRRFIEGMQYKEIAVQLDMELNTVRTRIKRAKSIMEKMKQDEEA